jgi:phage terminase small subunit
MDDLSGNGTLSANQQRLLTALVTNRTVEAAATVAGVSKSSAYRWLKEPQFADALRRVELAALSEATRALISLHHKAVETLENVMDDPDAPAGTRVRAASEVVSSTLKLREIVDHEERIAALEQRLNLAEGRH